MSDKSNPVHPGDKLKAATINKLIRKVDDLTTPHVSTTAARHETSPGTDDNLIKIRNNAGQPLERMEIVSLTDLSFDSGVYRAISPDEYFPSAVVIESIPVGGIGLALAYGITQCRIDMIAPDHQFANVVEGDVSKLESAETGMFRILSYNEKDKIASVQFPAGGGGPAIDDLRIPAHDHRSMAQGGFSYAVFAPGASSQIPWD